MGIEMESNQELEHGLTVMAMLLRRIQHIMTHGTTLEPRNISNFKIVLKDIQEVGILSIT
jgi:hypothetical protein